LRFLEIEVDLFFVDFGHGLSLGCEFAGDEYVFWI